MVTLSSLGAAMQVARLCAGVLGRRRGHAGRQPSSSGPHSFVALPVEDTAPRKRCNWPSSTACTSTTPWLQTEELGKEVADLFRSLVSLSLKLREGPMLPASVTSPQQLTTLAPRELSFWVASLFAGNPYQQQVCWARTW